MIDVVINLAAAWGTTYKVWQDGDVFSGANNSTLLGVIGDRLGYLKTTVDTKVGAGDNVSWTGTHAFSNTLTFSGPLQGSGANDLLFAGWTLEVGAVAVDSTLGFSSSSGAGIVTRFTTGPDANATVDAATDTIRVPQLTGNRTWTVDGTPTPREGAILKIVRPRTADAFTLTLQREDATTLGVFPVSADGFIELLYTSKWVVNGYSNNITSRNTDVS